MKCIRSSKKILLCHDMSEDKADQCATIFTGNSIDGVYSHGVYRFGRFIKYIQNKRIDVRAEPRKISAFNGLEQWNGNLGPGPLNAIIATERAIKLAREFGIGCVALANTNHWMRGGVYGHLAAEKDCVFMGWTNTTANMPAWGAVDCRLGNNPFIFAAPAKPNPVVLDMAMTQYSWGAMEHAAVTGENMAYTAGFDRDKNFTNNPSEVLHTKRPLSMGYWKGAGFSLLLDIISVILSGGRSVHDLNKLPAEYGVSQVFIAIDTKNLQNYSSINGAVEEILNDYRRSTPVDRHAKIQAPGDRVMQKRRQNMENNIPVLESEWINILSDYNLNKS